VTSTAIRAARLVDGTGAPALEDPIVLVEGSKVVGVFQCRLPAELAVEDLSILDLPDCTLLPGMVDTHVHVNLPGDGTPFEQAMTEPDGVLVASGVQAVRSAFDAGITTLRDTGGRMRTTLDLRRALDLSVRGPRLLVCGPAITIMRGHCWHFGGEASGVEGVRRAVRALVGLGVDFIKVMGSGGGTPGTFSHEPAYTREEMQALADEAHRHGRRISVHCLCARAIEYAVDAGVDQIEHAGFTVLEGGESRQRYEPEIGEKLARSGIPVTATLSVAEYVVRALDAKVQRTPQEQADLERWRVKREEGLEQFGRLYDAGVAFVAGSDAGWRHTPFDALPVEIELMHRGGMRSLEAIAAATGRAAAAIGLEGTTGVVRQGLEADIVAVGGDPLQRLGALADVHAIMRGGRLQPGRVHHSFTSGTAPEWC
jgi:imidazolonepropionase-like amidohydrolase